MVLPAIFTAAKLRVKSPGPEWEAIIEAWTVRGAKLQRDIDEIRAEGRERRRLHDDTFGQQDADYYAHQIVAQQLLVREGWTVGHEYDMIGGVTETGYAWTIQILPEDFDHGG